MKTDILIPRTLQELLDKVTGQLQKAPSHAYADYVSGWLKGAAENKYRYLVDREKHNGKLDARTTRLLCELAIAHAIIAWHEVRDSPPPMPDIRQIDSLF